MEGQGLAVLTIVVLAVLYLGGSLGLRRRRKPGCSGCPHNRNKPGDYA